MSFRRQNDVISFGFLRFNSSQLVISSNVDQKYKSLESRGCKEDFVEDAFKSLKSLWTNDLIEKSVREKWETKCFNSSKFKKKRLFEVGTSLAYNRISDDLSAWKTIESKNDSSVDRYYRVGQDKRQTLSSQTVPNDEPKFQDNSSSNSLHSQTIVDSTNHKRTGSSTKTTKLQKNDPNTIKRLVSDLIDREAEVVFDSIESFSDDEENTQKELSDGLMSFVDDNTYIDSQPIGQLIGDIDSRATKDMESVYLQSVKDRLVGDHFKYKLQYDYDPNIDVYSQESNECEIADYELDSFCVPNDCVIYEDSPQTEPQSKCSSESPSPQMKLRQRKKFKRIIFDP